MILIGIFFLVALISGLSLIRSVSNRGWRESSLLLFSIIYFVVILLSEGLSCFDDFHRFPVAIFWWIVAISVITLNLVTKSYRVFKEISAVYGKNVNMLTGLEKVSVYFVLGVIVLKLTEGMILPPTTQDALAYHIPRFFHWFHQGNLSFYETFYPVQNYIVPGYSLLLANIDALFHADYFYFIVQWTSFVLLGVTCSLIAKILGAGNRWQLMSAVFTWLMPIAVAQSTSTYCDLLAAATLISFVYFYLKLVNYGSDVLWCGIVCGLAVLSKTQNILFVPILTVVIALLFFPCYWRSLKKKMIVSTAVIALIAGSMLLPHVVRNYSCYGRPIGCEHNDALYNYPFSLKSWFYTQTIQTSDLCALPISPVNKQSAAVIKRMFPAYYGNPRYHSTNTAPFKQSTGSLISDTTGTFFPVILLWLCGGFVAAIKRKWRLVGLLFSSYVCFATFCAKVAWMPWNNRFFIGELAFASTVAILTLSQTVRASKLVLFFLSLSFVFALPSTFVNMATYVPGFVYRKGNAIEYGSGARILKKSLKDRTFFHQLLYPPDDVPVALRRGYHFLLVPRESRYWGSGTMSQLQIQPAYHGVMKCIVGLLKKNPISDIIILPLEGSRPFPLEWEYHYWRLARASNIDVPFLFLTFDGAVRHMVGAGEAVLVVCSKDYIPSQGLVPGYVPELIYTNNAFAVYNCSTIDQSGKH